MTDYEAIYRDHAEAYDRMVRAEDCDGELRRALASVTNLGGAQALEIGVGTGRVTEILLDGGCRVVGFDRAPAMIAVARRRLAGRSGWEIAEADARSLPVEDGFADLAVAGWVLGHMTSWEGDAWRAAVTQALDELRRAVRPGGPICIIETLGTGTTQPAPPHEALAAYYRFLEEERGMDRRTLRTDYRFDTPEEAARCMGFFFGEAFAARVLEEGWARVPECTGLWVSD